MSSKKTKRAGKPNSEKRATHNAAEQNSDITMQSKRPNQITYPFDSPHIREKQVIPWLCSVVYSGEYLAGGKKLGPRALLPPELQCYFNDVLN